MAGDDDGPGVRGHGAAHGADGAGGAGAPGQLAVGACLSRRNHLRRALHAQQEGRRTIGVERDAREVLWLAPDVARQGARKLGDGARRPCLAAQPDRGQLPGHDLAPIHAGQDYPRQATLVPGQGQRAELRADGR